MGKEKEEKGKSGATNSGNGWDDVSRGEGLPLFLASKEAGGYHQKYNSGNPKKLFLRENKKVLSD